MTANTETNVKQTIDEAWRLLGKLRILVCMCKDEGLKNDQLVEMMEEIKELIFSNEGHVLAFVGPLLDEEEILRYEPMAPTGKTYIEEYVKIVQARDERFLNDISGIFVE